MTPAVGVQGAGLAEPFSKPGLPRSCVIPPLVTVRVTVVVWLVVPPTPVMVTVAVPRVAVDEAVKVTVEVPEPGAAIEAGLKEAVTPAGRPEAEREMAELKPPETAVVTVTLPEPPCAIDAEVGAAAMVKSGVVVVLGVTEMQVEGSEAQASLPLGKEVTW